MSLAAQPDLEPGRAYRTRELRRWSANPTRLARRLVRDGQLREAAQGLFYVPVESRFGKAPAGEAEVLRAFLGKSPFVITGPPEWNALGLGSTAMFAATLVYNKRRTGQFTFDGRHFLLRRVLLPGPPPPEWFVVDLLDHHEMAGVSLAEVEQRLTATLRQGRWERVMLRRMAGEFGTKATLALRSSRAASPGRALARELRPPGCRVPGAPGHRRPGDGIATALVGKDYRVTHTLWAIHVTGLDIWFKGRHVAFQGLRSDPALLRGSRSDDSARVGRGPAKTP